MAPCFIGDAGVLHNCRKRLLGLSCLVALFVFALGVCCGLARSLLALPPPSPSLLVGPLPSGPVSALLVPSGIWLYLQLYLLVNHYTFNCVSSGLDSDAQAMVWRVVADWLLSSLLLMATKASALSCVELLRSTPCWGAAQVSLALALSFSPLGDPEPLRTPLKLHAPCKILLLRASFSHLVRLPVPEGSRELIFWAFRPGHILDSQYMKCSMTLHVSWYH